MLKKTILFLALITINFNQFCAQEAQPQKTQVEVQKAYFFLFIDTQTNVDAHGLVQLLPKEAEEINSLFETQDILFVTVIATDVAPCFHRPAKGETPNLQRHGDCAISISPNQIPRYFPLSLFYEGNKFKKECGSIRLIKNVTLDNGQSKTVEFIFTLHQYHSLSKNKVSIDDLLREYLSNLLKRRCETIKESESPIFNSKTPLLTIAVEEHEFGPLPSAEMLKLIEAK